MNDRVWTSSEVPATAPGSAGARRSPVSVGSRGDRALRYHPIRCPHSSPAPFAGRSTWVGNAGRHRTYCAGAGRHYLIGRYYDPQTGQFLSVDPKVEQTKQAYLYVGDDPVNSTDPSGQSAHPCLGEVCLDVIGEGLIVDEIGVFAEPPSTYVLPDGGIAEIRTCLWVKYHFIPPGDVGTTATFNPPLKLRDHSYVSGSIDPLIGMPTVEIVAHPKPWWKFWSFGTAGPTQIAWNNIPGATGGGRPAL